MTPSHLTDKIFKQDKLNYTEFLKIKIQKNANADVDVVAQFCKAALACTDVSRSGELLTNLEELVTAEGTTTENYMIVSMAKAQLSEGARIHSSQNETLKRLNNLVQDSFSSITPYQFVRDAFKEPLEASGVINKNYPFIYEQSNTETLNDLKGKIDGLLREKYLTALSGVSCKITQLSAFALNYKKAADKLRDNGYSALAAATENRIKEITNEITIQRKYEPTFAELEKDLSMCSNADKLRYSDASDRLIKLQNWISFFASAQDIPKKIEK